VSPTGPKDYDEPIPVFIGESWKPEITVRDGVRTSALPDGATVDISSANRDVLLTIYKPDGSANYVRSLVDDGTKTDAPNGKGEFAVADTVTALWGEGVYAWEMEYQDSTPTPETKLLIATGTIVVRKKPSAS